MWIIVIAIIIGLAFAGLLYLRNRKQHYGKALAIILFTIRTLYTSLIILLFFNPFFKIKKKTIEPATIIIAQDNSTSLILSKDSTFYKNEYPNTLDSLTNELKKSYIVDKYLFGNKVREFDSIDYQDYYTDFHNLLTTLKKDYYKKNVGAVVLFSDGICNKSYLPEQTIESFPFPIYSVTLGDTTNYPDFYIKDILYNKTASSNTILPIRLIANARNCRNNTMKINILYNNEIVEEKEIFVNSNQFSSTIDLNINSGDEGAKQIDIQIENIDNEVVINNNKKQIFINVIDKQHKILFYAKSPHPDLGSIKSILGDNFESEIIFNDEEIPDFKDYDIIVLHQIPFVGMNNLMELDLQLKKNKSKPIFYIVGEHTDFKAFNNLQSVIEIKKGAVNSSLDIKPNFNNTFGLFKIDHQVAAAINSFPPLTLPHLEFSFKTNHDIILQMKINDVMTQSPLLCFSTENNDRKSAFLFGTAVWRWKLYDYYSNKNHDNFEELFSKSIKYLLTEKDKELTINHKENYLNNEPIIFSADLKNPSQELTTEPELKMLVTNKHSKKVYEYNFSKNDKSYYLKTNSLPNGIYDFKASAQLGNLKYLENGSFSVVSIGAEAQELTANAQRMQLLSNSTNGKNFNINELNLLIEELNNNENITSIEREEINYQDLINWKSLFFIILSLVSIEWILRKIYN